MVGLEYIWPNVVVWQLLLFCQHLSLSSLKERSILCLSLAKAKRPSLTKVMLLEAPLV
jgi:hypothetical protein